MKQIAAFFVCLLVLNQAVFAVDPGLDWKTIEGEHIYVHYAEGHREMAERVLSISEAAHQRLSKELNWYPEEKTHVILSDEIDLPNGYTTPINFNRTVIFPAPPTSINTLEDFDDWLDTLIVHEYAHIIHLDKSAGSPESLRNIFGRFFLLFPNLFQPAWVHEGLATQVETDIGRGIGRGQSTMFASMMREEVANGIQPVSHVNLPVNTWPAGTTRYLYGVYFMQFVKEKYGEEKLHDWLEEYSDNLLPFFFNTNASQTLGKDVTALWDEFSLWLDEKFRAQIDAIQSTGIVMGTRLSGEAYRTDAVRAVTASAGEEIYYVQDSGYKKPVLMHVKPDGKTEELLELNFEADLDVHPEAGLLLTQLEFCNNYTAYKDIYLYDVNDNELKRLTECGRYLYASWSPDGEYILAVHHEAGHFELHRLDANAALQEVLWRADDGEVIGQIDVSPDGNRVVAAKWDRVHGWNIELFDLTAREWTNLTRGTNIVAYPQYDPKGDILFSMETNGVYNLYRYHCGNGTVEQITNLTGGAFQSSQADANGAIYYVAYTAEGYAIYKLEEENTASAREVKKSVWHSEERLHPPAFTVAEHQPADYSALSNMYPRWWFPTYEASDQRNEIGVTTTGNDALGIHNYAVTVGYDTRLERPAGRFSYTYADRFGFTLARLNEITLYENGDLNRISSRDIASMVLAFPRRHVQSQSDILLGVTYDKTSDDKLEPGAIPYRSFEDNLLGLAWLYNSANYNPLSISLIDGMKLRLVAEDSDTLNADFTGQVYTLDWRQYIRTGKESVLSLRFLQGWGTDRPQPFELGGEGFNEDAIDILYGLNKNEGVFDRREYALRGYKEGLPQLRGRRAQLFTAEWRFPLSRVEKGIMAPPVGIMQYFGSVFAETGSAYQDSPETYYTGAGIELNVDFNLFYGLTLRTRLGYAHGFDKDIGDDRVYLQIGSSF